MNVSDAPELCSFTLLSTHSDGPLHIGISTSGRGCKLAARLRREIASSLPANLGLAIDRLGMLRKRIWEEDRAIGSRYEVEDDDSTEQKHTFNALVTSEDVFALKNRRIRWLSQICEYWPLRKLAAIDDSDIDALLTAYSSANSKPESMTDMTDRAVGRRRRRGKIILAGAGPGHPDLLTRATYDAIKNADIILADKLVPAPVLELIPRRTEVHIARKFPGNADQAQEEFLNMGLEALREGRHVLRLKQGDPYLYGRGAEEYDFFRSGGYEPVLLPGITSALSAPLFAGIPPTHRSIADQVLICTGTGRKGAAPDPPNYVPTQTVIFLMALHRLSSLVESLVAVPSDDDKSSSKLPWPKYTPCAVVERASCPDQRVIRSTLQNICAAVEEQGSRPPGLLVIGSSCRVLHKFTSQKWVVEDGFKGLDGLCEEGDMSSVNALVSTEKDVVRDLNFLVNTVQKTG